MTQTKKTNSPADVYYKCKKCKGVVCGTQGAIGHSNTMHNRRIKTKDVPKYFVHEKNPSKEIIQVIEARREYQRNWRKNHQKKNSKSKKPVQSESSLVNLEKYLPEVVDITHAEAAEDGSGAILTVRVKISTPFIAQIVLPTLTKGI